ncbi:hypothetical protein N0V90_002461 [Kalmusia sp. IMI 367209]|nr:hypothetical protein N0V90_002461 [Kalmusia sp. IMI 367209]
MMSTKVMSLGSTSGAPTPPNPTPCTEALTSNDKVAHPDFDAVGRILGPIQEDLNEKADVAMLPSPPINTPEAFSPAPSVYRPARSRGFSLLGDRLNQLKLQERSSPYKDSDTASSNRSVETSIEEDEGEHMEDDTSSTGKRSTPKNSRFRYAVSLAAPPPSSISIALGSPSLNPRIEEYVHFSSKDLPVTGPTKYASSSTQAIPAHEGSHTRGVSRESVKSDGEVSGVTEKSTWAEEVEDAAERSFLQLEQLAVDEYIINPNRSMEDHYLDRLQRLLTATNQRVKVKVIKDISSEGPFEAPTEVPEVTTGECIKGIVQE